jgi:hypothetical protein
VLRFAGENRGWGYDRIIGALANLGHQISDQTVGNIMRRHNLAPARPNGVAPPPGRNSSGRTSKCSPALTSSPWRC